MLLFLLIFFSVYILINIYMFRRVRQGFESSPLLKKIATVVYIVAALSYVSARSIFAGFDNVVYTIFLWIGSVWFAFLLYLALFVFLGELLRLIGMKKIKEMKAVPGVYERAKLKYSYFSLAMIFLTLTYGYFNAQNIVTNKLTVHIASPESELDSLRIVFFADSHLTPVNNKEKARKIVEAINAHNPDMILAAGDIVDDHINRLLSRSIDAPLKNLRSKYGTFVCNGNHEYIVGVEDADKFLSDAGITVLRDTFITIANSITIAGREDSSISRFTDKKRKNINELMNEIDKKYPVVILDHQPFNLGLNASAGASVQLSGHTHHGQMWPANLITSMIYEISWGYKKIDNMHAYVTSGVGTWGPPIRTGSDAEILLLTIYFNN